MYDKELPDAYRRLRGLLAERQITHKKFAATCGLSRAFFCHVLAGRVQPGELARIKIGRAVEVLGLNRDEGADRAG